jgi:hypothetical protein
MCTLKCPLFPVLYVTVLQRSGGSYKPELPTERGPLLKVNYILEYYRVL